MRITEITSRHRNDFQYRAKCEHCGHVATYGDGYADAFYCLQVVPNRYCPECGKNTYGKTTADANVDQGLSQPVGPDSGQLGGGDDHHEGEAPDQG